MPFTLAHPAAVLPMMRRPLVGLALVCGALAPDLPYYVRATRLPVSAQSWYEPFTNATASHSVAGLLTVTLPLGLVLYLLVLAATPPVVWLTRGRWGGETLHPVGAGDDETVAATHGPGARWVWVPVSLVLGAATHLLWDSFASSDGFLAHQSATLNTTALAGLTWIDLLQHGSSVIGLAVIAVVLWRRRRVFVSDGAPPLRRTYWAIAGLLGVGVLAGAVSVAATFDPTVAPSTLALVESVLTRALLGGGAAVGVVAVLAVAIWWVARLGRMRRPATSAV